jgi:hypothetical protein
MCRILKDLDRKAVFGYEAVPENGFAVVEIGLQFRWKILALLFFEPLIGLEICWWRPVCRDPLRKFYSPAKDSSLSTVASVSLSIVPSPSMKISNHEMAIEASVYSSYFSRCIQSKFRVWESPLIPFSKIVWSRGHRSSGETSGQPLFKPFSPRAHTETRTSQRKAVGRQTKCGCDRTPHQNGLGAADQANA